MKIFLYPETINFVQYTVHLIKTIYLMLHTSPYTQGHSVTLVTMVTNITMVTMVTYITMVTMLTKLTIVNIRA